MQRIGRYEIQQELGRGAAGTVYKAIDTEIGRTVALKIIHAAHLSGEELERYRQRFKREAQAAGKLSHPGIVTLYDISEDAEGHPYLVMEFVEGITLHHMLRPNVFGVIEQRLPLAEALDLGGQLADAIEYAHRNGVVHRDIKPGNVLVTAERRAKITDFGIARIEGAELTHTATVSGTPSYMAPEQFRGAEVDGRTDIFSLGSMLYWMTTGHKAFPGDTMSEVSFKVVYSEPAPPRDWDPQLPDELEIILSRCLAKLPSERYATAGELARDLLALKEGRAVEASRVTTGAPGEGTVTGEVPIVEAMPRELAPAQRHDWLAMPRPTFILAALLTVVGLSAFWVWTTLSPPPPLAVPQPARMPARDLSGAAPGSYATQQGATSEGSPAIWPRAGSPEAARRGFTAMLGFECKHNFRKAVLEIYAGSEKIFAGKLEGKRAFPFRTAGTLRGSVPISPGLHALRVRVTSDPDNFMDEAVIAGTFAERASKFLTIGVGRGSGVKLAGRKVRLEWGQPASKR